MNIVLISSKGRCGIHEYTQILGAGFGDLGHRVQRIGVEHKNNLELMRSLRQVRSDDQLVVFEYDAGIFRLWGLIWAMAWLRFGRRKRVLLSVHEIEPVKFPESRQIQWHLARPVLQSKLRELIFLLPCFLDVAWRFWSLRIGLLLMGALPHVVLVHSPKAAENVRLSVVDHDRINYVPHVVKRLDGDQDALRKELGLPQDRFAFIIPGFIFRRKRIIEVIEQLPPTADLWVVGTESKHESGYLAEIQAHLLHSAQRERVRVIQDYEHMEQYLLAADAVVLYYADSYQSGVASLAVGAGKPCIFADLAAFSDLRGAGLIARTSTELRQAMVDIQDPILYRRIQEQSLVLREQLSSSRIAAQYLASKGLFRNEV